MPKNFVSRDNAEGLMRGVANKIPQKSVLPTAAASNLGTIYQYIGETGNGLVNGYFYKCVSDGAVSPTYSWVAVKMPADGEWRGTSAEYELIKDNLPNDTVIIITDRTASSVAVYPGAKIDVLLSNQGVSWTEYSSISVPNFINDYDLLVLTARNKSLSLSAIVPPSRLHYDITVSLYDGTYDYGLSFASPAYSSQKKIRIKALRNNGYTEADISYAYVYGIKF